MRDRNYTRCACRTCLFRDVCAEQSGCEYYCPGTEEAENRMLRQITEVSRRQFRSEWREYLTAFSNER